MAGGGPLIPTEGSTIHAGWVGVGRNRTATGSVDGGTGTIVIGTNGFLGYATGGPGTTTPLAAHTFAGANFIASAQQYTFTESSYSVAGRAVFTAAPVPEPEPETWASWWRGWD